MGDQRPAGGVPVVVDAVLKGIANIDPDAAYSAVKNTLTQNHKNSDWLLLERYGYYPFDLLDRDGESVSRTLEHCVDDAAAARLAEYLGKREDFIYFSMRAEYYRHLFDSETGFMRGKDSKGQWRTPFEPLEVTSPMNNPGDYTEANAYQYSWAAQHATDGMIELFGSKAAFAAKLDEFFDTTMEGADMHLGQEAMIGQYAHGNEPSHHIAYLYQFAERGDKTRALVNRIYASFYHNRPDGIQGNEDCGQMSAWYIFSTLGFYPVDPVGGEYILGYPQVTSATINLPGGKQFSVNLGDSQRLNGKVLAGFRLDHKAIMQGGSLQFKR